MATTEESARAEGGDRAGGRPGPRRQAGRPRARRPRRLEALHALRRPPVLDLRRLRRRGHRHHRHPPRAGGGLGGRGLREGDPQARGRGADRRPRGDQRDERDGRGEVQPLAAGRARRPRARDALGLGLAPGDRPPAVRLAGDQVGRDGQGDRRDRGAATARAIDTALTRPDRPDLRRLSARRRLHGGRGRAGAEADRSRRPRPTGWRRPPRRSPAPSAR